MSAPEPPSSTESAPKTPTSGGAAEASNFSLKLQQADDRRPAPPPMAQAERAALAEARLQSVLKGWRLTRVLGVGPVTAAFEAQRGVKDAKERAVLKLVIGPVASSEHARSLFLRASYAANRFNHSRVVPILEDGTDTDGAPFVVRPWANAETLSASVAKKPLDEKAILRVAEQVLDALEMAHAHGILHGAIKPSNVLVTERRSIRLCDFGTPPGVVTVRAAEEDMLAQLRVGPYTAPERCGAIAHPATEVSDIYSVAACMYFAATGKAPRGDAAGGALAQHVVPKLRDALPEASVEFAAIVDHALLLAPQERYESAYAMLGDVRRVMAGRRPKLNDALAPVPSASMRDVSQASPISVRTSPSSRRVPTVTALREPVSGKSALAASLAQRRQKEFRGNAMLILAIALLVGVATFVLVRERVADQRGEHHGDKDDPAAAPADP